MGLLSHGCLSTFIELNCEDILVNEVPNNWSLEDAVTVPLAYYVVIIPQLLVLYLILLCETWGPRYPSYGPAPTRYFSQLAKSFSARKLENSCISLEKTFLLAAC